MKKKLVYPFDNIEILRKYKSIKKDLIDNDSLIEKRIFVASGATTDEIIKILEIFLLFVGIKPLFYQGDYGVFYEDLAFENKTLQEFQPDMIFIHTSTQNLKYIPEITDTVDQVNAKLQLELDRFINIWSFVATEYNCSIIQNNFELPSSRPLGNLECSKHCGTINFINMLNQEFANQARNNTNFFINDINYLSAYHGLEQWFSYSDWHRSKHSVSLKCVPFLAHNISNIVSAICGKSKKALVLDLDNTLWGGVIGDDGVSGIKIGDSSATSEAFLEFQKYIKKLYNRGVILTIASKNDVSNAIAGLNHPEAILTQSEFTSIKANWSNKADNIEEIVQELNVFDDAVVFIDDNPVERESVRQFLPEVTVLEMTDDISDYINILDKSGCFEMIDISKDDLKRNSTYMANKKRVQFEKKAKNYTDFLLSLNMKAEIKESQGQYLNRIAQLINKTNQFNLTTKRYSLSEIETFMKSKEKIVIYGKLEDKFGDNGIISVMICNILASEMRIDLWVMSCRVFKRNMEYAMFDELVKIAKKYSIKTIKGVFIPSSKNQNTSSLYETLGFKSLESSPNSDASQHFEVKLNNLDFKNKVIEVNCG
jgi:FkbH-like protein